MWNRNYTICVRTPHSIAITPPVRNALAWELKNDLLTHARSSKAPIELRENELVFNDNYPLHDLSNKTVWELIASRGFFTLGLEFIHPKTGSLWQGQVEFNGNAEFESTGMKGVCYEGYAGNLRICIEQGIIASIQSRDFFNIIDGKSVKIHAYTPVCFDAKEQRLHI